MTTGSGHDSKDNSTRHSGKAEQDAQKRPVSIGVAELSIVHQVIDTVSQSAFRFTAPEA